MLSGWNWFVDPTGPGNRIWLAWDDSEVVIDILSVHVQCIHCLVLNRRSRVHSLVTIAYGLNDAISRRVYGNDGDTAMGDFRALLIDTGLITTFLRGIVFTWHNCSDGPRSLWKKLDRMLVNESWLARWPNSSYLCPTLQTSDHSPLVLRASVIRNYGRCFRFDNYLAKLPGFIDLVRGVWEHPIVGTPMYSVTRKLKALKPKFRAQRKEKGDLTTNVNQAKGFLERSNSYWRRIIRMSCSFCLKGGSTIVTESYMVGTDCKTASQKIFQINSEHGDTVSEESAVAGEFVRFYMNLLGGQRRNNHINLMFLQPWARYVISQEEGEVMVRPVEREEVKNVVFDIAEDKAPGPDGYSAGFFKAAWSVIGTELTVAIQDFFISAITECVCADRRISNNILLGQELFHGYKRQNLPPRCALKVDLRKAYDTLEWDFINTMLHVFGFPDKFIMWIVECISTTAFSVSLNGELHGFFQGARDFGRGILCHPTYSY
ncbi:UNVERIFIED_CONTAM: hypothetical protein Slati_0889900 [Sesamum latifolium]|uniref:Reverse transcriptase domain-containing protein n=1 Tax=Sesamum latifolium TaxID=2727402 RepID=A0AAW2XRF4_9LAMI